MALTGVIVNVIAIIVGSLLGRYVLQGISERFKSIIQHSQGLFVVFIGVSGALASNNILLLVLSILIGSIIGEAIDIDKRMHGLGEWASIKLSMDKKAFSKAFVSSSVLFCAGSMAVLGPMQSGLSGDHTMLYMKSILDGTFAIFLTSTLGIGVLFSFIPILVYQGAIALGADFIRAYIDDAIIGEMSAAGSILLIGIGFNLLVGTKIKIANMVPAIFLPWPLMLIYQILIL
jgi:uncharacterized membrane protein YqgA involved in biofilm formation